MSDAVTTPPRVLGADVARGWWVGVVLGEGFETVHLAPTIGTLVDVALAGGPLAAVGIDIPIGLPDTGRRRADTLARTLVGRRWPSVFTTPVRAALLCDDHAEAVVVNRSLAREGLSRQAHGLRHKILEVDAWVRGALPPLGDAPVVEVHPEVSFAEMAGTPMTHRKTSWAGVEERRALLRGAGVVIEVDLGEAGAWAAPDDVLDAAAAAWSARRVALGRAVSHPDPPERHEDGWPAAIWA